MHGNVRDLVPVAAPNAAGSAPDPAAWGTVSDFLAREMFGRFDVVLAYDVGKGLRPLAGPDPNRLRTMAQWLTERIGNAATWPRDPDQAIAAIDAILERNLIDPPEQRKRIAVVLDYAQYLVPDGEAGSRSAASRLVRVLDYVALGPDNPLIVDHYPWAAGPYCWEVDNVTRLRLSDVVTVVADPVHLPPADAVLADVPCSNTGVLGRRVEVRSRLLPETFVELAELQRKLLVDNPMRLYWPEEVRA
jgi:hypothetical protein